MTPAGAIGAEGFTAAVFVLLLVALPVLEARWPRRTVAGGWRRRARNLGLIAIATVLRRWLYPLGVVGFAAQWPHGLLHAFVLPAPLAWGASLFVLDGAIYAQHRGFHAAPALWRFHRVHHSDTGFDTTLGVRFHPVEIGLSLAWKLVVVAALGAPAPAVAAYEATLLGFSLITHANIALPAAWDRVLRRVVVTPDWHRVHHSVHRDETDSNFANLLTLWDRLFGTARAQPRDGHAAMRIGLSDFREPADQGLFALLIRQPLAPAASPDGADAS